MSRLDEVKARLANVTRGPFRLFEIVEDEDYQIRLTEDEATLVATATDKDGAKFYANAPDDMAWAIERIEALEAGLRKIADDGGPDFDADDMAHQAAGLLAEQVEK